MTTLQQALQDVGGRSNSKTAADIIFATTLDDVLPILEMFEEHLSTADLSVVAMMLALFISALRKYPDLTV